jgi:hypothetical protein
LALVGHIDDQRLRAERRGDLFERPFGAIENRDPGALAMKDLGGRLAYA